jgi:hypothetical protein
MKQIYIIYNYLLDEETNKKLNYSIKTNLTLNNSFLPDFVILKENKIVETLLIVFFKMKF